jgi:hypothetical protein
MYMVVRISSYPNLVKFSFFVYLDSLQQIT